MSEAVELLERAVPPYTGPAGDWPRVLRDAGAARRTRLRPVLALAAVAAAVAAVVVLAGGGPPSTLDRALAAAGEGQILHLVFETDMPKTFVNLETGERREVRGRHEVWFDARAGWREREVFDGVVQWDTSMGAAEIHPHAREIYTSLGAGYRDALRSGKAQIVSETSGVYWIRIAPRHDVAVSRESYRPVSMRVADHETRILTYETLRSAPLQGPSALMPMQVGGPDGERISRRAATVALGRAPLELDRKPREIRRLDLAGRDGVILDYGDALVFEGAELAEGLTMMVGLRGFEPPAGTLVIAGANGLLRAGGLAIVVHAADEATMLQIARELYDGS